MQSWIHVLEWRATGRSAVTALVDDRGAAYSYAGLRAEYERRAGGWAALGIGPGDVVAIVAKNSADFLVHTFALLRAGATPAFVNWRLSPRELTEVLALVEPAAVAADAEFTGLVDAGARDPGSDRRGRPGAGRLAGRRRPDRPETTATTAIRRRHSRARAHERHDRHGEGDPAAAWRADDERR